MAAGIIGKKAARTSGMSSVSGTSKNKPAQQAAPGQLHYSTSSSDASALASMNRIRAQQGLAPQTQIGVKAPSRSSSTGPTTVDTKTNTVKDRQGNVLATGSSLSEALAKQTQLSTGSAPSVSGRPDLYAVAPGKNQEVRPYYDAYAQNGKNGKIGMGTGTMVTPKTATAGQLAQAGAGTLESFNKAQGLTYLDPKTFEEVRKGLNESDLIRGQDGQIYLKQGLTLEQARAKAATAVEGTGGATGDTLATDFSVDVPDTISTDTIAALTETPVTETDFNQMLAQMQVKQDELLAIMVPGADEIATQKKIDDIRAQAEKMLTEESMGLNNVEDQPIAMQFITGQQASISRNADAKLQNMARIEKNLLAELGLEQEARKVKASVAETQLGYLQTNLDVAFKVKQLIQQQEDSVFNRTMALKTSAQNSLTTILDTMKGMDESDLSADQQKQLQDMAIAAGIPYSLITEGMKAVKHQLMFDNALATSKVDNSTGGGSLTANERITQAMKLVDSGQADSLIDAYKMVDELVSTGTISDSGNQLTTTINGDVREGGSASWRNNNPGNIKYSNDAGQLTEFASSLIAQGIDISAGSKATDGGNFIAFPSLQAGSDAMSQLLSSGSYSSLSANDALKRWSNNGYGSEILPPELQGKTIGSMSPDEKATVVQRMISREGFTPGKVTSSAELKAGATTESAIRQGLANILPSMTSVASQKQVQQAVNKALSEGRIDDAKETLQQAALSTLPATSYDKGRGRYASIQNLKAIGGLLNEYVAAGGSAGDLAGVELLPEEGFLAGIFGKTGIVTGGLENFSEKVLKSTNNTKLADIANQIGLSITDYRNAVSGAAFTPSELKSYQEAFPSISNSSELNTAKINSLVSTFERNQRSDLQYVIGPKTYDNIFPPEQPMAPVTARIDESKAKSWLSTATMSDGTALTPEEQSQIYDESLRLAAQGKSQSEITARINYVLGY